MKCTTYFGTKKSFLVIFLVFGFFIPLNFILAFQEGDIADVLVPSCMGSLFNSGLLAHYEYDPLGYNGDTVFRDPDSPSSQDILYYYSPETRWIIGIDSFSNNFTWDAISPNDPTSDEYVLDNTVDDCTTETADVVFVPNSNEATSSNQNYDGPNYKDWLFSQTIIWFSLSFIPIGFIYGVFKPRQ